MSKPIKLLFGDCIAGMATLEPESVDLVLTDPPYGTTGCKWDSVIPFDAMWAELNRVVKPGGAIVLFGSEPFSSNLRMSNIKNYKYDWVWEKSRFANQMMAKYQPLKIHENIMVFNSKVYNPQGLIRVNKVTRQGKKITDNNGGGERKTEYVQEFTNYPRSILQFKSVGKTVHSTQKPVDLLEYLIETYSSPGEVVLDFTMGSGSTGVACVKTGRSFIGIENDEKYYQIAKERITRGE